MLRNVIAMFCVGCFVVGIASEGFGGPGMGVSAQDILSSGFGQVCEQLESVTDGDGMPGVQCSMGKSGIMLSMWGDQQDLQRITFMISVCFNLGEPMLLNYMTLMAGFLNAALPGTTHEQNADWLVSSLQQMVKGGQKRRMDGCDAVFYEYDIVRVHRNIKITIITIPPVLMFNLSRIH